MKSVLKFVIIIALCFAPLNVSASGTGVVSRHENSQNKIALTFDDGPHSKNTEVILDILKKYGIKATFFVIGENACKYPEIVLREIEEGHEIGNHTYYHKNMRNTNEELLYKELTMVEDTLTSICGNYSTKLFRPPEGFYNKCIIETALEKNYNIILWTIDTEDWRHKSADEIEKCILGNIKAGAIILCHDFVSGSSYTAEAMDRVIPKLIEDGYVFVTVSELIDSV